MRNSILFCLLIIAASSCTQTRVKEHKEWGKYFEQQGITNACFELRDNNHESIHYYNKERATQRFTPASTFKVFNSLVALETGVAPDEQLVIKWDSVVRWNPDWNHDMTMREAFKVSNVAYYQEIARRIGAKSMQHYLDTIKYGNMRIGDSVDNFWLNDTLKITADEQVGFLKRLYFNELPVSERSQRIVKSLMLREETPKYKLYYKTGTGVTGGHYVCWVVGFVERIQHVKEDKDAMNKSDVREYPYFFAMNLDLPHTEKIADIQAKRLAVLHDILMDYGAIPK